MTSNSLAVTIDIEDWYHIPPVCGSPFSVYSDVDEFFEKWGDKYDYLSDPTEKVLNLLDEFKIAATFFIVADVAEHYPGLIESIIDRGQEIACHGLNHSMKIHNKTREPLMSIESFKARTSKAKNILEKISGEKVIGYRAPSAYVGGWMLDVLRDLKFSYDSSISVNSLYNKTDSDLRGVTMAPYFPRKGSLIPGDKSGLIEFPWAYYNVLGFKIPSSGGPILRFLGDRIILKGLKQSLKDGDTVFYFHPIDISTEKFPKVGKNSSFYWTMKGSIIEGRIRKILRALSGFQKVQLRDLAEYAIISD